MGTETDETSGRALKLDCLKQSSSSHDAESVENVVSKRFVSSMQRWLVCESFAGRILQRPLIVDNTAAAALEAIRPRL